MEAAVSVREALQAHAAFKSQTDEISSARLRRELVQRDREVEEAIYLPLLTLLTLLTYLLCRQVEEAARAAREHEAAAHLPASTYFTYFTFLPSLLTYCAGR